MNSTETLEQGSAMTAKVTSMVVLFTVSMIVGLLPMVISLKYDWFTKAKGPELRSSNQLVRGLLAFGGGVLFSTSFMHLLPEVDDNIQLLQEDGDLPELPIHLAPLIMCCGFFMMYLIEELVHMYIDNRNKHNSTGLTRVLSIRRQSARSFDDHEAEMEKGKKAHEHSHMPIDADDDSVMAAFRGLLIVLALSIHELFEGLAVGLESSSTNVWYMFGAVSAHKYIIAFCVGVELLAAGTKLWLSVVYIFTYSFMSALGIGVGILMVGGAGAAEAGIYSVVLQGLACGTLVYVVFFEVWRQDSRGMVLFFWALLGFTVMVALEIIVEIFV